MPSTRKGRRIGLFGAAMMLSLAWSANGHAADTPVAIPPALQAALRSGNADIVRREIEMLAAGDAGQATDLANASVKIAAKMLASNPQGALEIAAAVVAIIGEPAVQNRAPAQCLTVAAAAARIIVSPEALRFNPREAGSLAGPLVQAVSVPAIYAISPTTALGVMSNAYSAAKDPAVLAVDPDAKATTVALLKAARVSGVLSTENPANGPQITAILAQPSGITEGLLDRGNVTTVEPQPSITEENPTQRGSAS